MRTWFLLFLLSVTLFGAKIVNHSIYEKENSVDIMLFFDAPYQGKIIQKKQKENKILMLQNAELDQTIDKDIISPFVQHMKLLPYAKGTIVTLMSDSAFDVKASKTVDNQGLRLRITPIKNAQQIDDTILSNDTHPIQTKKEDDISSAYLKVLLVLAILGAFLYLLKRFFIDRSSGGVLQNSWLFNQKGDQPHKTRKNTMLKILKQQPLDHKNRIALISFEDRKYLLLLGESNLLLDRFDEFGQSTPFENELKTQSQDLTHYLKETNHSLTSYKEKASKEPPLEELDREI